MTLFTRYVRPVRDPAYWRAWIDTPVGLVAHADSKQEAIGLLVVSIASMYPALVTIDTQPPVSDEPAGPPATGVVISGKGGAS